MVADGARGRRRRTKVVCTIGPSTSSEDGIRGLIEAGMDVARLNFSHGEHEEHRAAYTMLRRAAEQLGRNVAIMMDLQGPKMRTGSLRDRLPVQLVEDAALTITARDVPGDVQCVSTTYKHLPNDVKPGDRILLADGTMELSVERVAGPDVVCRVVRGGSLGEHKGINLPGVDVSAPSMTEKDIEDLHFGLELGVDFVALSFVRSPQDINRLNDCVDQYMEAHESAASPPLQRPGVVAKIERPEALECIDEIISLADAIMVARGDLGIEVDLDDIPQIQKDLIRRCNLHGKPAITATQMLESMISNARPTRAEVTDVANAIYDGTDAVMLSGETAVGRYPKETVRTMASIAEKADAAVAARHERRHDERRSDMWKGSHADAIGEAVSRMCHALDLARVVCFTMSGFTAQAIARYRPDTPITAISLSESTKRRCAMLWGVDCLLAREAEQVDEMLRVVDEVLLEKCEAEPGETVLIVAGTPLAVGGVTNLLKLHTVGAAR